MKRLLYIILYMVLAVHASAQVKAAIKREQNQTRLGSAEREQARTEFKVTGRVIDLQNKPVSDVIVKLVSGTKTLAFTSSNAKGEYSLELKSAPSGERLRVGEQSSGMRHEDAGVHQQQCEGRV